MCVFVTLEVLLSSRRIMPIERRLCVDLRLCTSELVDELRMLSIS